MKQTFDGIVVERGSTITIISLAHNVALNLTAFPAGANWDTANSPIVVTDQGLSRSGTFQAPAAADSCDVVVEFGFVSDGGGNFPPGIDYVVTITETTPGGQVTTINKPSVEPPPIVKRPYRFITL